MKKKLFLFALAFSVMAMTACGKGEEKLEAKEEQTEQEKENIGKESVGSEEEQKEPESVTKEEKDDVTEKEPETTTEKKTETTTAKKTETTTAKKTETTTAKKAETTTVKKTETTTAKKPETTTESRPTFQTGTYSGSHKKEVEAMNTTIVYKYSITFQADHTYQYKVSFSAMGEDVTETESGTYSVEGSSLSMTSEDGTKTSGKIAGNKITISRVVSSFAASTDTITVKK